MKILEATIRWNSEANGCLEQPFSGIQPSFHVGGDLIMSRVEAMNDSEIMDRGKRCAVLIKLPYGDEYAQHLHAGMEVRLQVGGRVIATGSVDRIR